MDSCGSGYGPVAGSCERGNERSNYIKLGGGGGDLLSGRGNSSLKR